MLVLIRVCLRLAVVSIRRRLNHRVTARVCVDRSRCSVRVVYTHGSCNSWLLVLSMLWSWVTISIVSRLLMSRGRRRCCSLGILVLSIVHLSLRRLHRWWLQLSLWLHIWCGVLMSRRLRVLGLCRRSWLYRGVLGGDLWRVWGLRVCLAHIMTRRTTG